MRLTNKIILASVLLAAPLVTTFSAEPKRSAKADEMTMDRTPIRAMDWAVYMEAPAYHLALAKQYMQKGENEKAAEELKSANSFILRQQQRLSEASKQIEELAGKVSTGKDNDITQIDHVTTHTLKAIEQKYSMVPVAIGAASGINAQSRYNLDGTSVSPARDSTGLRPASKEMMSPMKL